jgi:hypothetical protein
VPAGGEPLVRCLRRGRFAYRTDSQVRTIRTVIQAVGTLDDEARVLREQHYFDWVEALEAAGVRE